MLEHPNRWSAAVLVLAMAVSAAGVTGCGGRPVEGPEKARLTLGAYTTPREAYSRAILPAFARHWHRRTGQEVEFHESYQGSGAQARAILSGFEADIAALSLEGDIERLVRGGLITHDWRRNRHRGMVSTSLVVFAVRPGNPLGIRDWEDLARPGIRVVIPDPKTSGGAQWNFAALYGAALRGRAGVGGGDAAAARDLLRRVLSNVVMMDKGARESITNFERGVGDVAVTYENEVLVARQAGRIYDYVVPPSTILIENPVALVDRHVDRHGVREVAEAFMDFLWTLEAQRAFAGYGLRPVEEQARSASPTAYPQVADLWRIDALGGWLRVSLEMFGPGGAYAKAFEDLNAER